VGLFQLTHQHVVNIVFVLSKQSFDTFWAYLGRFVSINLVWQSKGPFIATASAGETNLSCSTSVILAIIQPPCQTYSSPILALTSTSSVTCSTN
jgi:hypothetical protein